MLAIILVAVIVLIVVVVRKKEERRSGSSPHNTDESMAVELHNKKPSSHSYKHTQPEQHPYRSTSPFQLNSKFLQPPSPSPTQRKLPDYENTSTSSVGVDNYMSNGSDMSNNSIYREPITALPPIPVSTKATPLCLAGPNAHAGFVVFSIDSKTAISYSDLTLSCELGRGAFGVVWLYVFIPLCLPLIYHLPTNLLLFW